MDDSQAIDAYISAFPSDVQIVLTRLRALIHETVPDVREKISYGIPTFYTTENLVHFAAYKSHIGFYPTSSGIAHFAEELKDYQTSKGTVRFPLDRPVPYDLVRRITAFRAEEVRRKK